MYLPIEHYPSFCLTAYLIYVHLYLFIGMCMNLLDLIVYLLSTWVYYLGLPGSTWVYLSIYLSDRYTVSTIYLRTCISSICLSLFIKKCNFTLWFCAFSGMCIKYCSCDKKSIMHYDRLKSPSMWKLSFSGALILEEIKISAFRSWLCENSATAAFCRAYVRNSQTHKNCVMVP